MFHEKKFLPSTQLLAWYRWFSNWKEFCLELVRVKAEDHWTWVTLEAAKSWRAMKHSDREEPRPVGGGRQSEAPCLLCLAFGLRQHLAWSREHPFPPLSPMSILHAPTPRLPWVGADSWQNELLHPPVCLTQTPARWDDLGLLRALWLEYFKNSNWISCEPKLVSDRNIAQNLNGPCKSQKWLCSYNLFCQDKSRAARVCIFKWESPQTWKTNLWVTKGDGQGRGGPGTLGVWSWGWADTPHYTQNK